MGISMNKKLIGNIILVFFISIFMYILMVNRPKNIVIKVDGTIIVVRAGVTKKEDVHDTVNTLKKVNANIIGTVLHAVDNSKNKYYYYYGEE